MNVGSFKHEIVICEPDPVNETRDEYGRRHVPMREVARIRAHVQDVSGREFFEAAAHQLQNTVTFTLRWLPGITPSMWINWAGSMYQIDQVNHLGYRQDFIRIRAHATDPEEVLPYGQN